MKNRPCRGLEIAALGSVALLGIASQARAQSEQRSSPLDAIIVTARLRPEDAEAVPISLSVVNAATLQTTYTNNIAQLSSLVPSLNYVSPNPRNTAFTIRGLGSSVVAVSPCSCRVGNGVTHIRRYPA